MRRIPLWDLKKSRVPLGAFRQGDDPTDYNMRVCGDLWPGLRPEAFLDRSSHIGGTLHDLDSGCTERGHLLGRRALPARNDRAGVTHAASRRRRLAGDKRDDGFLEVRLD